MSTVMTYLRRISAKIAFDGRQNRQPKRARDFGQTAVGYLRLMGIALLISVVAYAFVIDFARGKVERAYVASNPVCDFLDSQALLHARSCDDGVEISDKALYRLLLAAGIVNETDVPDEASMLDPKLAPAAAYIRNALISKELLVLNRAQWDQWVIELASGLGIGTDEYADVVEAGAGRAEERRALIDHLSGLGSPSDLRAWFQTPNSQTEAFVLKELWARYGLFDKRELSIDGKTVLAKLRKMTNSSGGALFEGVISDNSPVQDKNGGVTSTNANLMSFENQDSRLAAQVLDGVAKLSHYLVNNVATSDKVGSAKYWMTLWRGYEQFIMVWLFVFSLLVLRARRLQLRISKKELARIEQSQNEIEPSAVLNAVSGSAFHFEGNDPAVLHELLDLIGQRLYTTRWPVRWAAYTLPAIGFIGTVRGILNSLSNASDVVLAVQPAEKALAIGGLSGELGLAFATTLIALLLGIILSVLNEIQVADEEHLLADAGERVGIMLARARK